MELSDVKHRLFSQAPRVAAVSEIKKCPTSRCQDKAARVVSLVGNPTTCLTPCEGLEPSSLLQAEVMHATVRSEHACCSSIPLRKIVAIASERGLDKA